MNFLQKPLAWFSSFYLRVPSKNCGRNRFFLIFLFRIFFRNLSEKCFWIWAKNFKKLSKLPSACADEQFLAWKFFFLKFWIFLDFLQKASACFSKFYLRVQSKTCGRKSFLIFLFRVFFGLWAKNFSDFWPKTLRSCQNYLLRVQINNLRLEKFLKFWIVFIFCRNLRRGPQISIYVSRVKFAEEKIFLILPFWSFPDSERKIFQTFGQKNVKNFSKLSSTCPEEQSVAWISSAWFSKFYLRVQSKNFRKNSFPIFLFRFFSDFERKFFSDSRRKIFKKVVRTTFYVSRGTICGWKIFLSFESFPIFCRNHWHGYHNSIYVSR